MIVISEKLVVALLRGKGLSTISHLAQETGVNRFTLTDILKGKRKVVQKETYTKLVDWLATQTTEVK